MTAGGDEVPGCLACDLTAGRGELVGGVIHETGRWRVEHTVGPLGVGTLIVKPIRHVLHVADLDDAETAEMGPLLRRAAQIVDSLCDCDQVYVCLWSHAGFEAVHIHFVVQPVSSATARGLGLAGPRYQAAQFDAALVPDPAEVATFCDRAREAFVPA